MDTDILEYTLAKFRETNDSDKHFDIISFHQYCVNEATSKTKTQRKLINLNMF